MASRQNKEAREVPSYGAPLGPPTPSPEREAERKEKLETKPTAEERRKRIEEHEERGIEETAKRRRNRRTAAPKPAPYESVRPEGGTPAEILKERGQDVETAIERAEGIEREPEPVGKPVTVPAPKPLRELEEPKRQ